MIFKQTQEVLDGRKRQTRRPVKPGEYAIMRGPDLMEWEQWRFDGKPARLNAEDPLHQKMMNAEIVEVRDARDRLKWKVGQTLAVQLGRGQKSIGRTPPIKAIRRERLQEISPADCRDEMGVNKDDPKRFAIYLLPRFIDLWESIYRKPSYRYQGLRWRDNPEVWVLEFEPIEQGAEQYGPGATWD